MNYLIESSAEIAAHQVAITNLCAPARSTLLNDHILMLNGNLNENRLKQYCAEQSINFAQLQPNESSRNYQLVAMDMDSTLVNIECIDEIADYLNLKKEVQTITEAAMRGEIDFCQSLTRRVALLKGLDASVLDEVYQQRLQLNPGAENLLKQIQLSGMQTLLVSGGFTYFTERLKSRLNLDHAFANQLEIKQGKLTGQVIGPIIDAEGKAQTLKEVAAAQQIELVNTIAIGDGANDAKMLNTAGLSVAYFGKPVLRELARININQGGLDAIIRLLNHNQHSAKQCE